MARRRDPTERRALRCDAGHYHTLFELRGFWSRWHALGLGDELLSDLQYEVMAYPTAAPIIQGTGGLRKMRWGAGNVGRRSGYRICYVYFEEFSAIVFMLIYSKNEVKDIDHSQKAIIRQLVVQIREQVRILTRLASQE